MAFRIPPRKQQFADLKGILAQSKQTDNALYQTVQEIIERLVIFQRDVDTKIGETGSGGNGNGANKNATYATVSNEVPGLPNSSQLIAGTNVTFDVPTANQLRINATPTGGGGGDVFGPASAGNNNVTLFDGTTGKLIKDSGIPISNVQLKPIIITDLPSNVATRPFPETFATINAEPSLPNARRIVAGTNITLSTATAGQLSISAATTGEEVFVGPSDPGSPPYELWYDVDEPAVPLGGHHLTHEQGGTDAIKLDDLATPDDNTDLNASISRHGLLPKLPNDPLLFLSGTGRWWYVTPPSGVLAAQPIGLTPADAGLIWYVLAPYFHAVRWNGFNWEFAPGDGGNGFYQYFSIVPQTGGWIHANGVATDYLVVGGTTLTIAAVTLPNLSTGSYFRNALWTGGGIVAASGSTGGSGVIGGSTDSQGLHGHSASAAADGAHAHGGTTDTHGGHAHAISTFFLEYDHGGSGVNIPNSNTAGGGNHSHTLATDSQGSHTHGITIGDAGAHSHGVSVNNHTHSLSGIEPTHVDISVYFRR